jgi:hypothetical protein
VGSAEPVNKLSDVQMAGVSQLTQQLLASQKNLLRGDKEKIEQKMLSLADNVIYVSPIHLISVDTLSLRPL